MCPQDATVELRRRSFLRLAVTLSQKGEHFGVLRDMRESARQGHSLSTRVIRAGTPATTWPSATSRTTTAPAPIRHP